MSDSPAGWNASQTPGMRTVAGGISLFVPKGDEAGKRLNKTKQAYVLAIESLAKLGLTMDEFRAKVLEERKKRGYPCPDDMSAWSTSPSELFPDFFAGKKLVVFSELTPAQKAATTAWQRAWIPVMTALQGVAQDAALAKVLSRLRTFSVGDSPAETAWTSEGSGVVFRLKELEASMSKSYGVVSRYALQQLRQVCRAAAESHSVGDELFMRAVTETTLVGQLIPELVQRYCNYCREHDIALEETQLRNLEVACAA